MSYEEVENIDADDIFKAEANGEEEKLRAWAEKLGWGQLSIGHDSCAELESAEGILREYGIPRGVDIYR